jgi:hypothetical protein
MSAPDERRVVNAMSSPSGSSAVKRFARCPGASSKKLPRESFDLAVVPLGIGLHQGAVLSVIGIL